MQKFYLNCLGDHKSLDEETVALEIIGNMVGDYGKSLLI